MKLATFVLLNLLSCFFFGLACGRVVEHRRETAPASDALKACEDRVRILRESCAEFEFEEHAR